MAQPSPTPDLMRAVTPSQAAFRDTAFGFIAFDDDVDQVLVAPELPDKLACELCTRKNSNCVITHSIRDLYKGEPEGMCCPVEFVRDACAACREAGSTCTMAGRWMGDGWGDRLLVAEGGAAPPLSASHAGGGQNGANEEDVLPSPEITPPLSQVLGDERGDEDVDMADGEDEGEGEKTETDEPEPVGACTPRATRGTPAHESEEKKTIETTHEHTTRQTRSTIRGSSDPAPPPPEATPSVHIVSPILLPSGHHISSLDPNTPLPPTPSSPPPTSPNPQPQLPSSPPLVSSPPINPSTDSMTALVLPPHIDPPPSAATPPPSQPAADEAGPRRSKRVRKETERFENSTQRFGTSGRRGGRSESAAASASRDLSSVSPVVSPSELEDDNDHPPPPPQKGKKAGKSGTAVATATDDNPSPNLGKANAKIKSPSVPASGNNNKSTSTQANGHKGSGATTSGTANGSNGAATNKSTNNNKGTGSAPGQSIKTVATDSPKGKAAKKLPPNGKQTAKSTTATQTNGTTSRTASSAPANATAATNTSPNLWQKGKRKRADPSSDDDDDLETAVDAHPPTAKEANTKGKAKKAKVDADPPPPQPRLRALPTMFSHLALPTPTADMEVDEPEDSDSSEDEGEVEPEQGPAPAPAPTTSNAGAIKFTAVHADDPLKRKPLRGPQGRARETRELAAARVRALPHWNLKHVNTNTPKWKRAIPKDHAYVPWMDQMSAYRLYTLDADGCKIVMSTAGRLGHMAHEGMEITAEMIYDIHHGPFYKPTKRRVLGNPWKEHDTKVWPKPNY